MRGILLRRRGEGRSSPGQFRDALGHRAWRAQRYIHPAVPAGGNPARDHRVLVTHPRVIRVCNGARAFAVTLRPGNRGAPGFHHRPDGRVAGELMERLGGHRRGAFCPLGRHRCGGPPGRDELLCRVICGATHPLIVSPGMGRWPARSYRPACGGGRPDSPVMVTAPKIRQLTDVSRCKLHQHLWCNRKLKCQAAWPVRNSTWTRWRSPVRPRRANCASH